MTSPSFLPQWHLREDRPGVALLILPALSGEAPSRCDLVLRLAEETDAAFLGPNGWQTNEFLWRSGRLRQRDGRLEIPLGQRICAQIEDFVPLLIRLPALRLEGMVTWEGITPPLTDGTSLRIDAAGGIADSMLDEPEEPPPPAAEPAEDAATASTEAVAPTATAAAAQPVTAETGVTLPSQAALPPHRPRWPWLVAAGLAVPAVALGLAWALHLPPFPPAPPNPSPAAPAHDTAPALSDAELHQRGVAAAQSGNYGEARQLLNQPERHGYGPTLLHLGNAAASIDFTPGLFLAPNDIDALHYYVAACKAGEAEARDRLSRLKAALEERASFGDSLAHEILRLEMPQAETACP